MPPIVISPVLPARTPVIKAGSPKKLDELIQRECLTRRNAIIKRAKQLCDDGAHYLWGAEGQKPNEAPTGKGIPHLRYAKVILNENTLGETCFCAAELCNNVCVGRFRVPGYAQTQPVNKVWKAPASPAALLEFVRKQRTNPGAQVGWGGDLTPRLVRGYADPKSTPIDYGDNRRNLVGSVVWGEGCDDTQHFDCGGFIRWVVRDVCGTNVTGVSTNSAYVLGQKAARPLQEGETMLPADILVYGRGHIAFALAENMEIYHLGKQYAVDQAEDAVNGLNYDKPPRGGHTVCMRLEPVALLNRKVAGYSLMADFLG